jgi:ATP citrate (pro-S)-lyase
MSLDIAKIRSEEQTILVLGNHRPIIQSVLDFDYMSGRKTPSIVGIITAGNKFQKFFWGKKEVLIPCFTSAQHAASHLETVHWMFNINSGRRAFFSTTDFFTHFPDALGGHIFAEDVPEEFALALYDTYQKNGKILVGTAGVGLIVPGSLKLGAVGGTDWRQVDANDLSVPGNVAVLSASGGMINEIITIVANAGHHLSFALCFGGDRFPTTNPKETFVAAEADPNTEAIVYYGELGGHDEYELAELISSGKVTKPVVCYIAGVIGESFDQPVQFGHAKALARLQDETASAKREALRKAGAKVANSIEEFVTLMNEIPRKSVEEKDETMDLDDRNPSMFSSTISSEKEDGYAFVGRTLTDWANEGNFMKQVVAGLLGREPKSETTVAFVNTVFQLSIDHGPQVSGALNTIVTARAGKNLVDSLSAGLLAIGPRFGGAVNGAAGEWFKGVNEGLDPKEHVEGYAKQRKYIMGIGHKKYRIGLPDPRTEVIKQFAEKLDSHRYFDYAKSVEEITSAKKGNLILNIDGHIAALLLDILEQEEGFTAEQLQQCIDADFFNAFFVIPRSIGFVSHYLDQKRLDEGLFRLPDSAIHLQD